MPFDLKTLHKLSQAFLLRPRVILIREQKSNMLNLLTRCQCVQVLHACIIPWSCREVWSWQASCTSWYLCCLNASFPCNLACSEALGASSGFEAALDC